MQIIPVLFRRIYDTPAYVALIPSLAVILDYSLTFFLAENTGMILQWEASPLVRFAVAHNIIAVYLVAIVLFYYGAAYAVLRILRPTRYYQYGVVLVLLVSVTHVLGGMSWQFRNAWYWMASSPSQFYPLLLPSVCLDTLSSGRNICPRKLRLSIVSIVIRVEYI